MFFGLVAAVGKAGAPSNSGSATAVALAVAVIAGSRRQFLCRHAGCHRVFAYAGSLALHHKASGHGPSQVLGEQQTIEARKSFTFRKKRDLIREFDSLVDAGDVDFALKVLSRRSGVHTSLLSKWVKDRQRIFTVCKRKGGGRLRKDRQDGGRYPAAEAEVYSHFLWRRRCLRLKTSKTWLSDTMLDVLASNEVD